jgi:hypothetical protein
LMVWAVFWLVRAFSFPKAIMYCCIVLVSICLLETEVQNLDAFLLRLGMTPILR